MIKLKAMSKLQAIHDGTVINRTETGKEIQRIAVENIDILPGFGFMDGGCLMFAKALLKAIGDNRCRLASVGRPEIVDHVVVQCSVKPGIDVFIDADGVATKSELINKMIDLEDLSGDIQVREMVDCDLPSNENIENKLSLRLNGVFETFPGELIYCS